MNSPRVCGLKKSRNNGHYYKINQNAFGEFLVFDEEIIQNDVEKRDFWPNLHDSLRLPLQRHN